MPRRKATPYERDVIRALRFRGFGVADIASLTGLTPNSVKEALGDRERTKWGKGAISQDERKGNEG